MRLVSETSLPQRVEEIERRIRWPAPAALTFLGLLAVLLVVAVLPLVAPPRVSEGLPDDPDVRAAAALLRGMTPVPQSGLAFGSALFGAEDARSVARAMSAAERVAALGHARSHLEQARRRIGGGTRPG